MGNYSTSTYLRFLRLNQLPKIGSDERTYIIKMEIPNEKQSKNSRFLCGTPSEINQDYIGGHFIHWGIAEKVTNKIIGTCGYYRGLDEGTGEPASQSWAGFYDGCHGTRHKYNFIA
jgi:hypothetical protein